MRPPRTLPTCRRWLRETSRPSAAWSSVTGSRSCGTRERSWMPRPRRTPCRRRAGRRRRTSSTRCMTWPTCPRSPGAPRRRSSRTFERNEGRVLYLDAHRLNDVQRWGLLLDPAVGSAVPRGLGGVNRDTHCLPLPDVDRADTGGPLTRLATLQPPPHEDDCRPGYQPAGYALAGWGSHPSQTPVTLDVGSPSHVTLPARSFGRR